jgi:glycosyltransferase involved in cell wall biosynthesis
VRILYLSPYAPERCGIADYTAAFASEVRAQGHEAGIVSTHDADGAPAEVVAALPASRHDVPRLVQSIVAWRADVVHVEFAVASYGTRLPVLLRLLGALRPLPVRVVVTLHEVTRDTESLRAVGRAIYRRMTQVADRVIVHTPSARDALAGPVGAAGAPTELVPHPRAELPAATASTAELRERFGLGSARVLLAFGFIHVDKGLDDLVSAVALLRDHSDVRLVVAGDVRSRDGLWRTFELRDHLHLRRVRRMIDGLGLAGRVAFTGYVPAGEMRPWFELAEAAVLPYTRIEQSGVANLAGAAGTPVLVSRVGGLVQDGADPRWSFPARDPEHLAAVLEDFLDTPGARALAGGKAVAPELAEVVEATLALYGAPTREERHVEYA